LRNPLIVFRYSLFPSLRRFHFLFRGGKFPSKADLFNTACLNPLDFSGLPEKNAEARFRYFPPLFFIILFCPTALPLPPSAKKAAGLRVCRIICYSLRPAPISHAAR
jgi:hypothetical protein